jgi:hypothetical protein
MPLVREGELQTMYDQRAKARRAAGLLTIAIGKTP